MLKEIFFLVQITLINLERPLFGKSFRNCAILGDSFFVYASGQAQLDASCKVAGRIKVKIPSLQVEILSQMLPRVFNPETDEELDRLFLLSQNI